MKLAVLAGSRHYLQPAGCVIGRRRRGAGRRHHRRAREKEPPESVLLAGDDSAAGAGGRGGGRGGGAEGRRGTVARRECPTEAHSTMPPHLHTASPPPIDLKMRPRHVALRGARTQVEGAWEPLSARVPKRTPRARYDTCRPVTTRRTQNKNAERRATSFRVFVDVVRTFRSADRQA